MTSETVVKKIYQKRNEEKALVLSRFFKTGLGQYGEGDLFLGVTVPELRVVAKEYIELPLKELRSLIDHKYHEVRLTAVIILTFKYEKTNNQKEKEKIFKFYLANSKKINNWDLVDLSAPKIVGDYCVNYLNSHLILKRMAKSKNLWERRIAIVSTFCFIKNNKYQETFDLSEILLEDKEELINKAVGWMLREVGKRVSRDKLEIFLTKNSSRIPRTTLRYAIEHFEEQKRKIYLNKKYK